jgi:hypothetical protein
MYEQNKHTNSLVRFQQTENALAIAKKDGLLPDDFRKTLSIRDLVVYSYQTPKIRDLDAVESIKNALKYVFDILGLSAERIEESIVIMPNTIRFIQMHLKNFTPDDIKTAFDLLAVGSLDVDEKSAKLYNQPFNASYISMVMNSYQRYRHQIIREEQKRKEEEQRKEKEKPKTSEQIKLETEQFLLQMLIVPFEKYCQDGTFLFPEYLQYFLYDKLKEAKLDDLTKEERAEIMEQAEKKIRAEINESKISANYSTRHDAKKLGEMLEKNGSKVIGSNIRMEAKRIAFCKLINRFRDGKVDLRDKLGLPK